MSETQEKVLFTTKTKDNKEITVTNSRLIIPVKNTKKTYALAHVNSVHMKKENRSPGEWIIMVAFALVGLLTLGSVSIIFNIIMLCLVPIIFYLTRPQHYVYISVVGEAVPTYGSYDKSFIQEITEAINNAIIYRG